MTPRRAAEDPLGRLFDEHATGLLRFLAFRTGDRALAEDILGDTFERALAARRRPRGDAEKAWLYAIALNRLRDLARRSDAEQRALGRDYDPRPQPDAVSAVEDRDLVHRALAGLPEDERTALSLRYGGDLALREIAELTGERQTTIEGRIYRGLRRMRTDLQAADQIPARSLV